MKTLLVVDDEDDVLEILELCLTGYEDWQVTTAAGGAAAIDLLGTVDGVLLDVDMPEVDGRAVLAAARATRPDLPVVFLTADIDPERALELCALGALAVLHKPFDPLGIAATVADALGWVTTTGDPRPAHGPAA